MAEAIPLPPASETSLGLETKKLGMWVFLGSEVMFFTGLIGSYIVLRFGSLSWPDSPLWATPDDILNVPLTALNTFILICSSVTMVKAFAAIGNDDQRGLKKYLVGTVILGAIFLSIQAYEYSELIHGGLLISGTLFGACFFTLTGFHGAHVTIGVLCMIFVMVKAFRGGYSQEDHTGVEIIGLYWHFVDLVWIILFTIVYLI